MPTDNYNQAFSEPVEDRACCSNNNNGGFFGCCDSEILFFIIIFLLLFTNFGCGCRGWEWGTVSKSHYVFSFYKKKWDIGIVPISHLNILFRFT